MSANKFHFDSTAMEVIEGHDLTGYNVIITGANSGIGVETTRALAKAGATCFMTARNTKKAQSVLEDIVQSTGNPNVHLEQLELDSLDNVNAFVQRFLARNVPLHILINNAGVMACPLTYTRDGFENQFGTNHVGHFALTVGLLPCLKRAHVESGRNSRVVNLSSLAHAISDFDFEDYNYKTGEYESFQAYGRSKTANVLFTVELNNRFSKDGVFSNAVMPGVIKTNLSRHLDQRPSDTMNLRFKSIEAGASTTIWAAVSQEFESKGGLYLEDCQISVESDQASCMKAQLGYTVYIQSR